MDTAKAVASLKQQAMAIACAIKALGEVPSGHLYAQVMDHMDLAQYELLIGALVDSGYVQQRADHMLTWSGPKG